MSGAIAIPWRGKPPGEETFLQRLERAMREGSLPDPRTGQGVMLYGAFGVVLGVFIGLR